MRPQAVVRAARLGGIRGRGHACEGPVEAGEGGVIPIGEGIVWGGENADVDKVGGVGRENECRGRFDGVGGRLMGGP